MQGMIFSRIKSSWLLIGSIALMLVLVLSAVQQYRWMNRVSEADRRQRREYIDTTLRGTTNDFRETILDLLPAFRPAPTIPPNTDIDSYLAARMSQWRETSDRPQMLKSVSVAKASSSGVTFRRLGAGEQAFKSQEWPDTLTIFRTILEQRLRMPGGEPPLFPNGFAFEFFDGHPTIVFPLVINGEPPPSPGESQPGTRSQPSPSTGPQALGLPRNDAPPPGSSDVLRQLRPASPREVRAPELLGWCFLQLDQDYLRYQLIPELVNRHFSREALADYQLAVVTDRPPRILYQSDATVAIDSFSRDDAWGILFDRHAQPGRPGPPPPPGPGPPPPDGRFPGPPPMGPPPFPPPREGNLFPRNARPEPPGPDSRDAWRLLLRNRAGPLEAVVDHERNRNLALSFGVLLIIAGSLVLLGLATMRARSLAKQQMEFVAGVSHELRTPLTVIQSASYNLSTGMIEDPERVRKYGNVIQDEARRLINQVEQMLSFAGIRSGRRIYDLRPTDITEVLDRALLEYSPAFEELGWTVERHFDDDLPKVMADAQALESAIRNLLENGLKYAAQGKWLCVSARALQDGKHEEVQISVSDRGPGIAPADLSHIFEPFFRGRAVFGSSTRGAGLGLSLVERHMQAHGGRVTVKSSEGEGTTFTLHLPVIVEARANDQGGLSNDDG